MRADSCAALHLLLQAELDGELDVAGAAAIAAHVETCADCAALRDGLGDLSARLRGGLSRHAAPPALRAAILARLSDAVPVPVPVPAAAPAIPPAVPPVAVPNVVPLRRRWPRWGQNALSFGAGLAVAAAVAALAVLPSGGGDPLEAIVGAHIRALQPGHLVDVQSSDRHTVKPWFDGRLDYAPPVRDFAAQGFPLLGGRLDYIAGRPVAALAYGRDKHLIDLFVWPAERGGTAVSTVRGYNVIEWTEHGMAYRAVSDLNAAELGAFARLLRTPEP